LDLLKHKLLFSLLACECFEQWWCDEHCLFVHVFSELVERTCSLEFTENPEFDLVFQEDANTAFAQLIRAVVHVQCKYERDGQASSLFLILYFFVSAQDV